MRFRIAILAHSLRKGGGVSVGHNMLGALGRIGTEHAYFITIPSGLDYEPICRSIPNSQIIICEHRVGLVRRWFFETFKVPNGIQSFQPDVIVALGGRGLLNPKCPQIAFPQRPNMFYSSKHFGKETLKVKLIRCYHKWYFRRQLPATQLLICQTDVVKRRLNQTFNYSGRVFVCGGHVSPFMLQNRQYNEIPEPLLPYTGKVKLFCLAKYYAHKNLECILELFHKYRHELNDIVVITTVSADHHPNAAKFLRSIERLQLSHQVVNVGPIQHHNLAGYFQHCQALFMPTLMETFGLPYLEAMNFGMPILTGDLDFAQAVCGEAALYFDPWDAESIKNTILRLKNEPEFVRDLAAKGKKNLEDNFNTWDEIALEVMNELEQIIGGHDMGVRISEANSTGS